jgi:AbrB family looped-hinge helix DNA binding protein
MLKCKAMAEATVSSKNQIVIPKEAREALQVKPGDKLLVVVRGGTLIIMQKPASYRAAITGIARGVYPEDYLKKERESWD